MALEYVSIKTIGSMLARNHKSLNFEFGDVVEWSGECIEEIGAFESFEHFKDQEVKIINNRIELPCSIHRLLAVRVGGTTPEYSFGNLLITLPNHNSGTANVDYIAVKSDEEGYPMIDKASRQACYWYCLDKLMFEDYLNGIIPENRYQRITDKLTYWIDSARSSFTNKTRDDMNDLIAIMYKMSNRPRMNTKNIT